jgi:hypothetical protein
VTERPDSEAEIAAIFARLRQEVATLTVDERAGGGTPPAGARLEWRTEAQRHSGVTAERPYLFKPGAWGRLRGYVLLPFKAVLRRLMRWYVEPMAVDQRAFNNAALRLIDEVDMRTSRRAAELEESLRGLEARVAGLEGDSRGEHSR